MRLDRHRQWVGAILAEDVELVAEMLDEQPALTNSLHEAFDDPFRGRRFPVATLLFAVVGPPQQTVRWYQVRRPINRRMIDLLLDRGADPNVYSQHGRPLCWARELDIVERLIGAGGDINLWHDNGGSPLNFSVWQLDPERMRIQLAHGADVHVCDPINGDSALHTLANTARSGWARDDESVGSCLKLLLAAGADVSAKNQAGATPRDIADARGDKVLAAMLAGAAAG
jgi:ankyrin repeat protein